MLGEITIGIVEDHPLLRLGLVSALKPHKNIKVLFDVENGKVLLQQLKSVRPEILLLDIEMPLMRAPEVLERINRKYPKIKVIIVSAFFTRAYIVECFKLGVKAFLPKGDSVNKILEAIKIVHEKGIYTDTEVSKILAEELQSSSKNESNPKFTVRELEVLHLICRGTTRKDTAAKLEVALETVNFHMNNIFRKTGVDNVTLLTQYVITNKIINIEPR